MAGHSKQQKPSYIEASPPLAHNSECYVGHVVPSRAKTSAKKTTVYRTLSNTLPARGYKMDDDCEDDWLTTDDEKDRVETKVNNKEALANKKKSVAKKQPTDVELRWANTTTTESTILIEPVPIQEPVQEPIGEFSQELWDELKVMLAGISGEDEQEAANIAVLQKALETDNFCDLDASIWGLVNATQEEWTRVEANDASEDEDEEAFEHLGGPEIPQVREGLMVRILRFLLQHLA